VHNVKDKAVNLEKTAENALKTTVKKGQVEVNKVKTAMGSSSKIRKNKHHTGTVHLVLIVLVAAAVLAAVLALVCCLVSRRAPRRPTDPKVAEASAEFAFADERPHSEAAHAEVVAPAAAAQPKKEPKRVKKVKVVNNDFDF